MMDTPKAMTGNQVVFLALTIITWLILLLDLKTVVGVYAPGDRDIFLGVRWALAGVLVFGAWIWIAGMLLVAGTQEVLPGWTQMAALILCPASGAAAGVALYLVNETPMRWPLAVPALVPPLMAAYLFALYQPSLRMAMSTATVNAAVWGAMLALSVSVWPSLAQMKSERAQGRVQAERDFAESTAREKEAKRAENLEKLKTMSADVHLVEWYPLLDPEGGVRQEAIEALKKVPRRQGDVEEGLGYGIPAVMRLVVDLDLQPTPALCAAAQAYLDKHVKDLKLKREPYPYEAQSGVDWAVPGIRWLQANGCDCAARMAALEAVIGTYQDSPDRRKALAELAALQQGR